MKKIIIFLFAFSQLISSRVYAQTDPTACNCIYTRSNPSGTGECQPIIEGACYRDDYTNGGWSWRTVDNQCFQYAYFCDNNGLPPAGNCNCTKSQTITDSSWTTREGCLGKNDSLRNICMKPYAEYESDSGWIYRWDGSTCLVDTYECHAQLTTPPIVTFDGSSYVINWTTSMPTTGIVAWSDENTNFDSDNPHNWGQGSMSTGESQAAMTTSHFMRIGLLSPNRTYYYRIAGKDNLNSSSYIKLSEVLNFVTDAANPLISCSISTTVAAHQADYSAVMTLNASGGTYYTYDWSDNACGAGMPAFMNGDVLDNQLHSRSVVLYGAQYGRGDNSIIAKVTDTSGASACCTTVISEPPSPTPTSTSGVQPSPSVSPSPSPSPSPSTYCAATFNQPCCLINSKYICKASSGFYCNAQSSQGTCQKIITQNPTKETWEEKFYNTTDLSLDFNNDGIVNEIDYILWISVGKTL